VGLPFLLSLVGVLPQSFRFVGDTLVLLPIGFEFSMNHTPSCC